MAQLADDYEEPPHDAGPAPALPPVPAAAEGLAGHVVELTGFAPPPPPAADANAPPGGAALAPASPQHASPQQQDSVPGLKRGRTGVVSVEDMPGEGDGCDRCFGQGCDEEECCPSFWQDEGVPPIWPLSWVFKRDNKLLNDNRYIWAWGHCGLRGADRERKVLMGTALGFTVVSICLTTFGCLGLSPDPKFAIIDPWAVGHYFNQSSVNASAFSGQTATGLGLSGQALTGQGIVVFVGLRRLVIERCASADATDDWRGWSDCVLSPYWWSDVPTQCNAAADAAAAAEAFAANLTAYLPALPSAAQLAAEASARAAAVAAREAAADVFGYPCAILMVCAEQARSNQFGALVTCATLLFSLIGCLTRIRKRADSNFQKLLGVFPDLFGVLSLGGALLSFHAHCTSAMLSDGDAQGTGFAPGLGFRAYCCCWVAAVVRCSMHAVMPVPGAGVSCRRAFGFGPPEKQTSMETAAVADGGGGARGVDKDGTKQEWQQTLL